MSLVGSGGLLSGLTKRVLEAALEVELTEYLGYDGTPWGTNTRNSTRSKTALTGIGRIETGGAPRPVRLVHTGDRAEAEAVPGWGRPDSLVA